MKKNELVEIFNSLKIAFNEGESSMKNVNSYPRIVFWDYIWEDVVTSNEAYLQLETYQVSFFSRKPRDSKLIELRNLLREVGLHPMITHEFDDENKVFHSYFSIEVENDE